MGHYLVHDERKDPDPRVQDFIPDNWQRELLDIVDKNKSAVIMAPKSSWKTYTSYCCTKRVLHEGNERVVMYVAPTKDWVSVSVGFWKAEELSVVTTVSGEQNHQDIGVPGQRFQNPIFDP
ncbi:hypothetical protein K5549_013699 [Capra hircus]|nr:hypothetical protein K5549_013699 [Capra hircus]